MQQHEEMKEALYVARAKSVPTSKETVWMMIMQQIVKNKKPGEKYTEYGESTTKRQLLHMKRLYKARIVYSAD